jgi:hypothetical protein
MDVFTTTYELITLPSLEHAAYVRQISIGDMVIIILLATLVFLKVYELWTRRG